MAAKKTPKFTYKDAKNLYREIEIYASVWTNAEMYTLVGVLPFLDDLVKRTSTLFDGEDDYMACTDAAKSAQKFLRDYVNLYIELLDNGPYLESDHAVVELANTSLNSGKLVNECHDLIDALKPENPQE